MKYCIDRIKETISHLKNARNNFKRTYRKLEDDDNVEAPKKRRSEDDSVNPRNKYVRLYNEIIDTMVGQMELSVAPHLRRTKFDYETGPMTEIMKFLKETNLEEEAFQETYKCCLKRSKTTVRNAQWENRLTTRLGAAGSSIMGPLYVTEIVDDDIRGSLVSYTSLFASSGILFAYVVGYYASYTTFTAICLAMPVIFMASFFWMPETPVYLISQNNPDGARKVLMWLREDDVITVDQEMMKLEEDNKKGKENSLTMSSFIKNLKSRGTLKALLISVGLVVNNQLSGITAVLSYTVNIFEDASSEISANVSTIIIGALQMFGIYLMIILIDRAGRKILLIVSNVVSSACLAALGGFFYLKANGHDVTHLGWLPVTSLGMYIVTIALGVNSIPFVVINEIFNPQMRGFGVALFMCLLNVMAFLVTRFFTDLNNLLGLDGCYWFFAVCLVTMALFCYFIVPETKNKSLDSILKELAGEEVTLQKADESLEGSV
uniref:Major facilitator superfamily (MFS) profile domain-containing protein n=1 Tax=Timema poppense TaxID=170557 RepID=A0A7R9GSQ6_TIMPO|nr:unnamed protein product [Timema poppensis]